MCIPSERGHDHRSTTIAERPLCLYSAPAKELGLDPKEAKRFTGTPEDKLTYADWFKRQRPNIQDQIVGTTRGALYRDGKVQVERFVNNRGRQLTIPELMKREGLEVKDLPEFP
jgi:hypothetical protein